MPGNGGERGVRKIMRRRGLSTGNSVEIVLFPDVLDVILIVYSLTLEMV